MAEFTIEGFTIDAQYDFEEASSAKEAYSHYENLAQNGFRERIIKKDGIEITYPQLLQFLIGE